MVVQKILKINNKKWCEMKIDFNHLIFDCNYHISISISAIDKLN